MKAIIVIVVLLLLALVVFFVTSNQATAPESTDGVPATASELSTDEMSASESESASDDEVETNLPAMTFTMDSFNYGYSMEEVRVPVGTEVTINLTNSGGFHDWVVDEFGAATEKINAGGTTSVTFVADEVGIYEYYCSVGNHRAQGMVGTLIVE